MIDKHIRLDQQDKQEQEELANERSDRSQRKNQATTPASAEVIKEKPAVSVPDRSNLDQDYGYYNLDPYDDIEEINVPKYVSSSVALTEKGSKDNRTVTEVAAALKITHPSEKQLSENSSQATHQYPERFETAALIDKREINSRCQTATNYETETSRENAPSGHANLKSPQLQPGPKKRNARKKSRDDYER